jgi:ribulose-5-phosphate 4-epimerase/fuculose-1-phosphate aldolase
MIDKMKREFVDACGKAAEYGLVKCSSGNFSLRVDEKTMLITGSRSWMSELSAEHVSVLSLDDGSVSEGPPPSVESAFHAGILKQRRDVNAVLHFQSPYATVLCCRDISSVDFNVIPEIPYYIGTPAAVPYLPPGSAELAEAVIRAAENHDIILLANHGQVSVGDSADSVIQKAVFFELACRVLIQNAGKSIAIPEEGVKKLIESAALERGGA